MTTKTKPTQAALAAMDDAIEKGIDREKAFGFAIEIYQSLQVRDLVEAPKTWGASIDVHVRPNFSYVGPVGIFRNCSWSDHKQDWIINSQLDMSLSEILETRNYGPVIGWTPSESFRSKFSQEMYDHQLKRLIP